MSTLRDGIASFAFGGTYGTSMALKCPISTAGTCRGDRCCQCGDQRSNINFRYIDRLALRVRKYSFSLCAQRLIGTTVCARTMRPKGAKSTPREQKDSISGAENERQHKGVTARAG